MLRFFSRIAKRLAADDGFTLAEIAGGSLIGAMLLAALGSFLISSSNTGIFTQGQSATLDDVRSVMYKIEKEARGADSIKWCAPAGSCLEVGAQTPTGAFQTVRYTHVGTELRREVYDTGSASWGTPLTVVQRVKNTGSQPVFTCDSTVTLLRITVDLYIEPTPVSSPNLHVQTSIRPRNFPSAAICP